MCRLVDIIPAMTIKKTASSRKPIDRRIVGFSLPPALASKVKAEAGRRNISLRKLFEELWELYEKKPKEMKP
jgi:hypothetical protein